MSTTIDQSQWPTDAWVGGEWVATPERFTVFDPATGAELARVADADAALAGAALDAAADAAPLWARTPPRERAEILRRAYDLVIEHADQLAALITAEMGKPLAEARGEVGYGAEFLRWFSEQAVRIAGRYGTNPEGTGRVIVSRHPVGPCYLVTPWNFPLAMGTRKIAPALAAGCTVVLKPAESTPLTSLALAELLHRAGVPAGVVNVVPTSEPGVVTHALIEDPRLRKLSFTGSTAVGRRLLAQAAPGVLRTSMELGGNAPFLVFEDADLDAAITGAMTAKFRNIGQACTAANRFLVHQDVAEEFTREIVARVEQLEVGPGTRAGVTIGPLIDELAVAKQEELVADAIELGAVLLTGGEPHPLGGNFVAPTVLDQVPPEARLWREEIFGPVLAIATFAHERQAVTMANDTEFGLVGYAWTSDLARAQRLIESLEVGMLGLNTGVVSNAAAPFGGVKASGLGREGGLEGIEEYLITRYTLTPDPFD